MGILTHPGCIAATFTISILFFIIGVGGPFLINHLVNEKIKDGLMFKEDNIDSWGATPGESGVQVFRDYTLFNMQNSEEVIFNGAKPLFREEGPYRYEEISNNTDIVFSEDKKLVTFYTWDRYEADGDTVTNQNTPTKILKLGPLGVWEKIKKSPVYSIAMSVLNGIITNLNDTFQAGIVTKAYATVAAAQQPNTYSTKMATDGINPADIAVLLQDSKYGILSASGLGVWVNSVIGEVSNTNELQIRSTIDNTEYTTLMNYFGISATQLNSIRTWLFSGFADTANGNNPVAGIKYLYETYIIAVCTNASIDPCVPLFFTAAQWTNQQFTGASSIADSSASSFGTPELSYYYTQHFSNSASPFYVSDDSAFNVVFGIPWAMSVLAKSTVEGEWTKEPNALFNIGNMGAIFQYGSIFDAKEKQGASYETSEELLVLTQKFGFESIQHTYVFWNYLKYIVADIAMDATQGGNTENTVIGNFVSGGVKKTFEGLSDLLLPFLSSAMLTGTIGAATCNQFLTAQGLTVVQVGLICGDKVLNVNDQVLDIQGGIFLKNLCTQEDMTLYNNLDLALQSVSQGMTEITAACNPATNGSLGQIIAGVSQSLAAHYSCESLSGCSNFELAAKQWAFGTVTKNPPAALAAAGFTAADSVSQWQGLSDYFPLPIEFYGVSKRLSTAMETDNIGDLTTTYEQLKHLLSGNQLFSSTIVSRVFLWQQNTALHPQITAALNIPATHIDALITYFRFITINYTFGGFQTEQKTVDALFGYKDSFLEGLLLTNPQDGGNPTINPLVNVVSKTMDYDERIYYEETMFTGIDDADLAGAFYAINGENYITTQATLWDGFNVEKGFVNPWEDKIQMHGKDGSRGHPFQEEGDEIEVHISSTLFGSKLQQIGEEERHGLDLYVYNLPFESLENVSTNPDNAGQYFNGPNGLLNLTEAKGTPIFNSKTHFYEADQSLQDSITILNKDGNVQTANEWDETYVKCEKNTGISISVALNLQINYEMKPDLLFPVDQTYYLPIYYMVRGANWTETQVDDQFGGMKTAFTLEIVTLVVGILIGSLALASGVIQLILKSKIQKKDSLKVKSLDTLQTNQNLDKASQEKSDKELQQLGDQKNFYQKAPLSSNGDFN